MAVKGAYFGRLGFSVGWFYWGVPLLQLRIYLSQSLTGSRLMSALSGSTLHFLPCHIDFNPSLFRWLPIYYQHSSPSSTAIFSFLYYLLFVWHAYFSWFLWNWVQLLYCFWWNFMELESLKVGKGFSFCIFFFWVELHGTREPEKLEGEQLAPVWNVWIMHEVLSWSALLCLWYIPFYLYPPFSHL